MPNRTAHTDPRQGQLSAHLRKIHGNNQACLTGTEIRANRKAGPGTRADKTARVIYRNEKSA